jgi:type VI secretion system protein ImpG
MSSELLPYYERELVFVRKMAAEFAERYPDRAAALRLTRNGCDDPHVERLIEAFALVAGRIQRKIDEEFPEITQALLDLLYPHYLRPVPSMAIAQFEVDAEQSKSPAGYVVARGTSVTADAPGAAQCRCRTAYDLRLWPLKVVSAGFGRAANLPGGAGAESPYALRIEVQAQGSANISALQIDELRVCLGGDQQAAHWVYELLFNHVTKVLLRWTDREGKTQSLALPSSAIREVGFGREEALLPYASTSFQGYRLLQEYFCFPNKFLFFDLTQLHVLRAAGITGRFEIIVLLGDFQRNERSALLETAVTADTFQLGCSPIINLFETTAEPIRLSHARTEYRVIPDLHAAAATEVYSIDRVTSIVPYAEEAREYRPFYSLRHDQAADTREPQCFWYATRRAGDRDGSTDVYLSFVDSSFTVNRPPVESISVRVTASNSDLALRLGLKGRWGEMEVDGSPLVKCRVIAGPTKPARAPLRRGLQWRLISHLGLNHLSIANGGVDALREILRLYDTGANTATARQIEGITAIRSGRKMARLDSEFGFVFCQGISIDTEMDEDQFSGGSAFLLACVLERFFGLYCAVNSFTQLRATTRQRKGVVWEWPPRAGEQAVA